MSNKQVIKAQKISDIKIQDIVIGNKNNKTVPITCGNKVLVFQTPFLEVKGELRKTSFPNIYQVDTLFKGDSKQKILQWFQFIENIETQVSEQVMNNGSKWFTQKNVIFKPLIRELETEKGVYFIKWPLALQTDIFVDENKNTFNPNNLKDKDLIKLIVEISNLWINENQCGLTAVVQKILVKPFTEKQQNEYIFDETDSESEDNEKEDNIISLLATEQKDKTHNTNNSTTNNTANSKLQTALQQPNSRKQVPHKVVQPPVNAHSEHIDIKNKQIRPRNESFKKQGLQTKENLSKQKKLAFEEKEPANQTVPKSIKSAKSTTNTPFGKTNFQTVFSDDEYDSEDYIRNNKLYKNDKHLKQLLDEYTPSSNEAEINDDDLDFDENN